MARPKRKSITDLLAEDTAPAPAVSAPVASPGRGVTGTKARTIQQTLYLAPAVHEQLRELAFHERAKMHSLVIEGLDRVFSDRGLPSITDLKKGE